MTTTARFELQRHRQLKRLFEKERLTVLWRKLVKDQMRHFDVKDLHDYYDFNFEIEARIEVIIERVLSGQYRAEAPLIYRVEKKLGVCRHLLVPSPSDAIVFQVLTDVLYSSIVKEQPSKGAFFARDRGNLKLPHEHEEAATYPWFILWPRFQQEIWNFSKAHKYLVTTDLANYFDNIGLRELRHVISAIAKTDEVYLDLLFSLIEDLSWRPDYLPTSHKGLPTINIEAPRLLAHALLFEVDEVIQKRTKNCFVRWMDDINFGVDSIRSANLILGEVNDILKSRGLALNLSKTSVFSLKEAEGHFLFKENLRLTKLHSHLKKLVTNKAKKSRAKRMASELLSHLRDSQARNKDKVTKRYFTILGTLGVPVVLDTAIEIFQGQPSLRDTVLSYLSRLPFTAATVRTMVRLFEETEIYDDVTRFKLVEMVVRWEVPRDTRGKTFVARIALHCAKPKTAFEWFCFTYFLAKYGAPHEVLTAAKQARGYRAKEPFFARQSMAVLPRALGINQAAVRTLWFREISAGTSDSGSVATNLMRFLKAGFPAKNHRAYYYLFPQTKQTPYPIAKFLLLCVLARSDSAQGNTSPKTEVSTHVTDPWFRHWLKGLQPYWF